MQRAFLARAAAVEEISVTPVFGMAFMVHMRKRLSGLRPELIEPARKTIEPLV